MRPTTITREDQRLGCAAAFVERGCTIQHEGRSFEAGGAYRVGAKALVYVSSDNGSVSTWKGERLGTVVSATPVRLSVWSPMCGTKMYAYRVVMDADGSVWYGRGMGEGMCLSLRMTRASQRIREAVKP